jgi:diapolycopene oxygenase
MVRRQGAGSLLKRTPEPSSSGLVFLWAVGERHPALAHHNIFFSADYPQEFKEIFGEGSPPRDPTVYVSITSKTDPDHAPPGSENWFVLVNVPSTDEGLSDDAVRALRQKVLARLGRWGIALEGAIRGEEVIRPQDFRYDFNAYRGSIYGWASNSRSAAFLRPANRVRAIRGLYLCGGTAHPGGGIPLVILSGKIAASLYLRDHGVQRR